MKTLIVLVLVGCGSLLAMPFLLVFYWTLKLANMYELATLGRRVKRRQKPLHRRNVRQS